jgi:uncharacterized protein YndB with AHSA1/START domain
MADILHDFWIKASPEEVFPAISTPAGLDTWWTSRSAGRPSTGEEYELWFGPDYDWRAIITRCVQDAEFELELVSADPAWVGTRVGFRLEAGDGTTRAYFHHTGWPEAGENYRVSCYCWAMYLRILKRYVEHGERVPYDKRLDV